MTTTAENEMITFLAEKENLPHVLEILRRGEEIRNHVLKRFWTQLKQRLEADGPALFASDNPMKLSFYPGLKDPWLAGLCYADSALDEQEESLWYRIFLDSKKDFGYGVSWCHRIEDVPNDLRSLPEVSRLRGELAVAGFQEGGSCLGYQWLDRKASREEFLACIAEDGGEQTLTEISQRFLELIGKTRNILLRANTEICDKLKKSGTQTEAVTLSPR